MHMYMDLRTCLEGVKKVIVPAASKEKVPEAWFNEVPDVPGCALPSLCLAHALVHVSAAHWVAFGTNRCLYPLPGMAFLAFPT